jgi:hypothetical protein
MKTSNPLRFVDKLGCLCLSDKFHLNKLTASFVFGGTEPWQLQSILEN